MTTPASTVSLNSLVTVPTARPAVSSAVTAFGSVSPTRPGTSTVGKPEEITSPTAVPGGTLEPTAGFERITRPLPIDVLASVLMAPTPSSAVASAAVASACVMPITPGTVTLAGPSETTSATAV